MNTRKRVSSGQFANGQDSAEAVDSVELPENIPQTPPKISSNRKPQDSFIKSALKIVFSGHKEETQTNNMEALMNDCRTVYRNAIFFSTIIKLLHFTLQILKVMVAIYFVLNIFMQGILYSLTITSLRCLFGKQKHCYTKIEEIVFPPDMITKSPYLQVILKDSGVIAAESMFEISFPLTISNPIILFAILLILVCNTFFLAYFHAVLLKVARLAKDASREQNFVSKYGKLPGEL